MAAVMQAAERVDTLEPVVSRAAACAAEVGSPVVAVGSMVAVDAANSLSLFAKFAR
jgi:hypothetical protein